MGAVGTVLKNTVGLPFTRPKTTFLLVAPVVATAATMATSGLAAGPAFGAVAGKTFSATLSTAGDFFPYIWDGAVENTPGALESVKDWTVNVWDAAANEDTFDMPACA